MSNIIQIQPEEHEEYNENINTNAIDEFKRKSSHGLTNVTNQINSNLSNDRKTVKIIDESVAGYKLQKKKSSDVKRDKQRLEKSPYNKIEKSS